MILPMLLLSGCLLYIIFKPTRNKRTSMVEFNKRLDELSKGDK